jgi:hypothetical protein
MKIYINKNGEEYNSFIYIWKDNLFEKYYIGSHIGNIEDGYLFGGIDIKKNIVKDLKILKEIFYLIMS